MRNFSFVIIDKLCENIRFGRDLIYAENRTKHGRVEKSGAEIVLPHRLDLFLISHLTLQVHSPFSDRCLWLS